MNEIKPHYQKVSKIPGNGSHVTLNDNSDGATSRFGLGIQNSNLYEPPTNLIFDRGSTSSSGVPSTLFTNQSRSSTPRTQHDPQKRISALLMATDRPPTYWRNSNLDESAPVSPSSSNITYEKGGRSPRTPLFTTVSERDVELTSTATPEGREEYVSA